LTILISITTLSLAGLLGFFLFDERVISWLCNHPDSWLRSNWLKLLKEFGKAWLPVWLLFSWICFTKHRQQPALVGLLALLLIAPVVTSLKALVNRPRPNEITTTTAVTKEAEDNNDKWWSANLSFPSGDTAVVFAVATALAPFVSWPWVALFFTVAGIVGIKRITSLVHYPSDVFAGAIIGIFSAWLALQIILRWLPKFRFRRGHAAAGMIIIPIAFGVVEGTDKLLVWLKTYGVLVAGVYLIANAGMLSKLLRRRDDFNRIENTIITRQEKGVIFAIANTDVIVVRIFSLLALLLLLFTGHSFSHGGTVDRFFEISGLFLLSLCSLGRLWALRYISGNKKRGFVTEGPYSIVRHPLYLFTLIGAVGIGLASENVLILALIIIFYLFYYPLAIPAEETNLTNKFGNRYLEYMKKPPWFFPKFSPYKETKRFPVKTSAFARNFVYGMWFIWIFIFMHFIEMLQNSGVLPVVLRVP
jgi:protein-S-isoprenylcysteine O-methyltransferase Ste14/membrane-associated phospholipid phosphatase